MPKKLFAFILATTISFWAIAPSVSALTTEELQAQINALLAQLATLQSQLATMGGTTGTVTGCTITSFDRNLSQGMTGADVKCLQVVLNSAADTQVAASGAGSPGSETTYFGALTKAAVIKFQEKYAADCLASWGLTSGTGYVGSTTRAKLNTLLAGSPGIPPIVPIGTGFSVALAADNPAAGTIVADSTTNDGAQALIPVLKLNFSNGTGAAVKVTQLKFKRGGISADTDIAQGYLFDGNTKLIEYSSLSSGVMTFTNSAGLFTVAAGQSKTITLKFDLTNGTGAGKTMYFSLLSASDIASDAAALSGTFPIQGNIMTTASAADLGKLTVATSTDPSSTIDPQTDAEIFNFTLLGQDQKIQIKKIKFTNMGSTAWSDLTNLKLYDSATQLLTTMGNMASDRTITFEFGSTPLTIEKGVTKVMHLRADIVGGTNRTFQMSIQEQTDIEAYDTEYGIYIKPNASAWAIKKAAQTTINTGKLTIGRKSDSPSGNVPKDGTNITLAKFDLKALGEEVKIADIDVSIYGSVGVTGLYQTKVYFDGSQKGSTANASTATTDGGSSDTTYSFGSTFIVPADGTFHTLEIKGDIKKESGGSYSGSETLTAAVQSLTATGRTSLASVTTVAAAGNQLTIGAGTLNVSKNAAIADWSAAYPTGVAGQTEALIGSFVIAGGSGEAADITGIKISDDGTISFGNVQNLKVYKGTKTSGTQIGLTQSSLTAGSTYSFYPSPYVTIGANEQMAIYLYADIKTATTQETTGGSIKVTEVNGTGKSTNTSVDETDDVTLQNQYIATAGSLTIAAASDKPLAANLIAGSSENYSFAKFKLTAGVSEDIKVTRVKLDTTLGGSAPSSTLTNISLWDGSTQIGSTLSALDFSSGEADFNLESSPWVIPLGTTKYLTVKSQVNAIAYATSAGTVNIYAAASVGATYDGFTYKGVTSGVQATSGSAYTSNTMYTYKTGITVAKNANSPSVPPPGDGEENSLIFYFDVANLGAYSAYVNTVSTTISHSPGTASTNPATTAASGRTFNIYKDGYPGGTKVATGTIAGTTTINGQKIQFTLDTAEEIPAGTTKTFYLVGDLRDCKDTTGSNQGSSIRFSIASGPDFDWDDDLSVKIVTDRTKTFPVFGNTLQF